MPFIFMGVNETPPCARCGCSRPVIRCEYECAIFFYDVLDKWKVNSNASPLNGINNSKAGVKAGQSPSTEDHERKTDGQRERR
jgi:hypothetical protein